MPEALAHIKTRYSKLDELKTEYHEQRGQSKRRLAEAIEYAKESGFSISQIAEYLGKSRQAVNQVLVDVYGVRDAAKSDAAKSGHTK